MSNASLQDLSKTIDSQQQQQETNKLIKFVTFKIADENYVMEINQILEINRVMKLTIMPGSPPFFLGVTNNRGTILQILNLAEIMGFPLNYVTKHSRIIVIDYELFPVGIFVDSVGEVLSFPEHQIQKTPEMISHKKEKFLKGVIISQDQKTQWMWIDTTKIIEEPHEKNQ